MGSTPVCQINAAGIVRPAFADCLNYVQSAYRSIYGEDVYLGADAQDGQFMALLANAIHDCNGETVAAYNAFSPSTAQGAGLSSNVKFNGIRRKSATASTADVLIGGTVGTIILDGVARDAAGQLWSLPARVVIPNAGQVLATATCQVKGAVTAPTGTINAIATPTFGWQTVTNPSAATPGQPIETDAELRQRQTVSTGLPASSLIESLDGALRAVQGVARLRIFENDTNVPNPALGSLPGKSIAVVIEGGDGTNIAQVIRLKKGNAGTYGDIVIPITDRAGIPHNIAFWRSRLRPVAYTMTVKAFAGYTTDIEQAIRTALSEWTNALGIGVRLPITRAYDPANLNESPVGAEFEIVPNSFRAYRVGTTPPSEPTDLEIAFNERFICDPSDVTITVAP